MCVCHPKAICRFSLDYCPRHIRIEPGNLVAALLSSSFVFHDNANFFNATKIRCQPNYIPV